VRKAPASRCRTPLSIEELSVVSLVGTNKPQTATQSQCSPAVAR
jgi:hypothetical protein